MIQDGIKWSFNTPSTSHQVGIWERLIRSVKSIVTSVLGQQVLDDEGLQTLFCEVEARLNDRPTTKASDDPNDLEALTPSHILLLSRVTCTSEEDGSKYSILQNSFGKDGHLNTYL